MVAGAVFLVDLPVHVELIVDVPHDESIVDVPFQPVEAEPLVSAADISDPVSAPPPFGSESRSVLSLPAEVALLRNETPATSRGSGDLEGRKP